MQNLYRETDRRKQFKLNGKQKGLERITMCSHNLQSGALTSCSAGKKEKYSSCMYIISDKYFFCASDSSFLKQVNTAYRLDGIIANNREDKKSFPVCPNLFLYISFMCGSWEAGKQ